MKSEKLHVWYKGPLVQRQNIVKIVAMVTIVTMATEKNSLQLCCFKLVLVHIWHQGLLGQK